MAAMVVHATGESLSEPHGAGVHAVVLAADPLALQALIGRLTAASISFKAISDLDVGLDDAVLAIGIAPGPKAVIGRYVSQLPLLR